MTSLDPSALETLLRPVAEADTRDHSATQIAEALRALHSASLDRLPFPGAGATLERWQRLAQVAAADLCLAKLYESHTDALAILHECQANVPQTKGLWAVWAAEPPDARVRITAQHGHVLRLSGRKAWCSGARQVDHALLTVWDDAQQPRLAAIDLDRHEGKVIVDQWQAVGMAATQTVDLELTDYPAVLVGEPGQYVNRPGFWHGGIGIAACWYGAALGLAGHLHRRCQSSHVDPHALAHLGAVDAALAGARELLRASAAWVDANPHADASRQAFQARAQVEYAVHQVTDHVGRALGAAPFCRNGHFARLAADLPVFMRQSHAERDLAQLGQWAAAGSDASWML
ncbi:MULTISPECIES: acyl-CoA dehydrogenase family protein [unclassified Pseudomonas]|uniref:acyl-CoA dehydrogenase family protein n=1 Tax=unclassified Pseudomonas TaxID=196821 RepID=UPI000D34AC6F|nr:MULTISPECIES: acyl-CoA dehydrogenase family protein [unclassified Pseudomonas]RAU44069.1 acyl-CoA dehydrogenase [Pseudomonas sp. RIT 409]RAU54814.1 acyl-CoA dehydrogenase [Pseudomonas sp. RIT 412]